MPLVATAQGRVARFRVGGLDVEPREWLVSPPSLKRRRQYYQILAAELWHQKQQSLAEGEDRSGLPLAPVRRPRSGISDWHERPYRGGPGPPLAPYRIESRVRNLLRVRSDSRSAVVYWIPAPLRNRKRGSTGPKTFAELLVLHAQGRTGTGRKGQVAGIYRDVIGLPDSRLIVAVERAIRRWRLKEKPRPLDLPKTSRADAGWLARRKPEPDRRVSTRLGAGAAEGIGTILTQRLVGLFSF